VRFEATVSAGERPQTHALDRAATGTGNLGYIIHVNRCILIFNTPQTLDFIRAVYISQHSTNPSAMPVRLLLKSPSRLYAPAVQTQSTFAARNNTCQNNTYSDYYLPEKAVVAKSVNIQANNGHVYHILFYIIYHILFIYFIYYFIYYLYIIYIYFLEQSCVGT
jgi:hypothetical protein